MKKIMSCLLLLLVYQPSYSMDFLKNLFGYGARPQAAVELSKEEKQLQELLRLKKSIVPFCEQFMKVAEENKEKMGDAFCSGRGTGYSSHSKMRTGVRFEIEKDENDVMHFTLQNFLKTHEIISELTLDKKLFEDPEYDLLYGSLVSYLDILFRSLNRYDQGFLGDYTDEEFMADNPEMIANLKPKHIEKCDSILSAVEKLYKAIATVGEPIIEVYQGQKNNE